MRKIILEVAWEDIIQSFMGTIVSKYDPHTRASWRHRGHLCYVIMGFIELSGPH